MKSKQYDKLKDFLVNNNVNITHYKDDRFLKDGEHDGTYGSLMRFIPLFEKKYETVYISDIDMKYYELKMIKYYYDIYEKKKCMSMIFKYFIYNKPWINKKIKINMLAGMFITKQKFKIKILENFINKILENKIDLKDFINNPKNKYKKSKFPYGIDEYFCNFYLTKEMFKNDILKIRIFNIESILNKNYHEKNYKYEKLRKELKNKTKEEYHKNKDIQIYELKKKILNKINDEKYIEYVSKTKKCLNKFNKPYFSYYYIL
jgi:hypothetical protein